MVDRSRGLEALAGEMPQGDEGLTVRAVVLAEIRAAPGRNSRGIRARHGGGDRLALRYAAAWGSILVVGQDLVDDGLKRSQYGRRFDFGSGNRAPDA